MRVSPGVVARAIQVALVVGCILVAINHGDDLLAGSFDSGRVVKILLAFFVPYCVSVYSAAAVGRHAG